MKTKNKYHALDEHGFIGGMGPLTKLEEIAIHNFFQNLKQKNSKQKKSKSKKKLAG